MSLIRLGVIVFSGTLSISALACAGEAPAAELRAARPIAGAPEIPYPPALFEKRIEGEVLLYLVVDSAGVVVRDSTRIETSSGQPDFDAAAMAAAPSLPLPPGHPQRHRRDGADSGADPLPVAGFAQDAVNSDDG